MYVPGAEAADRGILLPLLVKAYAEAELLPEKRGAYTPGTRGRRKKRRKVLAASAPLRCIWPFRVSRWGSYRAFPSIISERSTPTRYVTRGYHLREGFRKRHSCIISGNIFPPFRAGAQITHNADISRASGTVRGTVGFHGFLVLQTFNSQDTIYIAEKIMVLL